MAVFAVHIKKRTQYAGGPQEFGNTYHYRTDLGQTFLDEDVIAEVVAAERQITSQDVTFVQGTSWGPTDGPDFDNVMRGSVELSGTGNSPSPPGMYREACILAVWPMERSPVTNRKRWLRKFIRMASIGASISPEEASGAVAIQAADLSVFASAYVGPVTAVGGASGNAYELCSEEGVLPSAAGLVRPYYYTRQIGQ